MKRRYPLTLIALLSSFITLLAQPEGADFMRSTGKIYVVVAVLATILIVVLVYLAWIDKKVHKIEKTITNNQQNG